MWNSYYFHISISNCLEYSDNLCNSLVLRSLCVDVTTPHEISRLARESLRILTEIKKGAGNDCSFTTLPCACNRTSARSLLQVFYKAYKNDQLSHIEHKQIKNNRKLKTVSMNRNRNTIWILPKPGALYGNAHIKYPLQTAQSGYTGRGPSAYP